MIGLIRYLSLIILMLVSYALTGQDSHYWSNQFGTRSSLLSGAVIAGYSDNSMIHYNPWGNWLFGQQFVLDQCQCISI